MSAKSIRKLVIFLVLLLALFLVFRAFGLTTYFSFQNLEDLVNKAGIYGVLLYFLLFSIGLMLYLPGLAFVFVAVLLYGPVYGTFVAYMGSVFATGSNFYLVRKFGGQPVSEIKSQRMRKLMEGLNRRPILTMFWIRLLFWLAPYITYLLAFSDLDSKKYQIGNAIGLAIPISAFALGFYFFKETMMRFIGG
jgi:uncharacterized membrane protein YdjX (TVP38/TMEM64 family)